MRLTLIACSLALMAGGALASPQPATQAAGATHEATAADTGNKVDPYCIQHTGSRIQTNDKDRCLSVAGRSYRKQDMDSTGATNVADALSVLDPAANRGH